MKIICDKCGYVIDKDRYVDEVLVEEYKNIYGTSCPNCKHTIHPLEKTSFDQKKEDEMKILREDMREKLRKNI